MKTGFRFLTVAALLALNPLGGCANPTFFQEPEWKSVYENAGLPSKIETTPEPNRMST